MSTTLSTVKQSQKFDPSNIKVKGEHHWWGFILRLNEDATQALETFDDVLSKALGVALQEIPGLDAVADLIVGYIKVRNFIIKAVDKGTGVKLTSPWIMPTLLVPTSDDSLHTDDSQLRWSVFTDDQDGWAPEQKMAEVFSEAGPTLAVFQDKLYCMARGAGSDQKSLVDVFRRKLESIHSDSQ